LSASLDGLRRPGLEPLWREAHRRLSSGKPVATLTVPLDGPDEREALADLLGLARLPSGRHPVRVGVLDDLLREAVGRDTREVVAELVGPVGDNAGDRAAARAERDELWAWVRGHPVVEAQPALLDWVDALRIVESVAVTRRLLSDALDVLWCLPAGGVPRAALAQWAARDPHALDDDTRLGGLVVRALATIHGVDPPTSAPARHALWERAGVSSDQLSVSVLAAGLRPQDDSLAAVILHGCADQGHAASLTLAQLRDVGRLETREGVVFAVENPSVLALALDRFGVNCPPFICTAGWPNGAATTLLTLLGEDDAEIRYHGDLDGEGIRIAAHLALGFDHVVPWRMSAADYRAAVRSDGPGVGRVTAAPWDPELAPALVEHGVAVPEEQVADDLLAEIGV
jgi:uncharacterized protein (TIGR02679 family)